MKFTRPACAVLACGLAVSLWTGSAAAFFGDTKGHRAESAIEEFASLKVVQGYEDGTFRPDLAITRAELCTILDRTFGYLWRAENRFSDVEENQWYTDALLRLVAEGVIRGDGDGRIRPNARVTWEEALVMICRAFGLKWGTASDLPKGGIENLSEWALGQVAAFYSAGYLDEKPEGGARQDFTRGDAVAVLNSIVDHLGWEAAGRMIVNGELVPYVNYHFSPGDFKEENGRVYYTGTKAVPSYGIDVSAHQKEIDWKAVAADGAEFAMIRLGYRGYTSGKVYEDGYFKANIEGALANGLKVGVYFFSQAITVEEAQEEARFVLKLLEPYRDQIDFPVVFDWEDIGVTHARTYKLDRDILDAVALTFCGAIEAAGYQPMIYFYQYLGEERYHLDVIDRYPFWYCYYKEIYPNLDRPFQIWQYTSSGKINGVQGNVDWNICFRDD